MHVSDTDRIAKEENYAGPIGDVPPERANNYLDLPNHTPR